MPTGDKVLSDGKEYLLGSPLKAGMIGIVYFAKNEQEKVAVKVPVPNLSREGRERFWQEYKVLNDLARKMIGKRFVPWVAKGEVVGRREEALLLEFVPEETVLTKKFLSLIGQEGLEAEKLALQAAVQYARLLEHLHSINYTCPDRKLADIRWLDEDERLVVLDWNVVETGTAGRANDLYLFGSLWYQLLSGRYPSPYLNPLDDSLWREDKITYGTRRLLVQVLAGGYGTAIELRTAVQNRLALLSQNALNETIALYEKYVQPGAVKQLNLEQEWEALDRLDLAVRQGSLLQDERDKALGLVKEQGNRLVSDIKQAFLTTQYDEGETAVQQATQLANSRQDAVLHLRIARWRTAIQAGQTAITEGVRLRPHSQNIENIIKLLEGGNEKSIEFQQERLNQIAYLLRASGQNPELPHTKTAKKLTDFYLEAQVRHYLALAKQGGDQENYAQAISALDHAIEGLQKIVTYPKELGDQLSDFLEQKEQYMDAQKKRVQLSQWRTQTDIASGIGNPAKIEYMLSRLRILASQVDDVPRVEAKRKTLMQLATLYRLAAYAQLNPQFWPDALGALFVALEDNKLRPLIREEAKDLLQTSYEEADTLAKWHLQQTDQLAAEIYTAGIAIQRSLTR